MQRYILLLLLALVGSIKAQITITRGNLISSGQKIVQSTHLGNYALSSSGTNMTWNFTDLNADDIDSMRFGLPFWYEGYENFPDANLAFKSYIYEGEVTYLKVDNSEVRIMGFYEFDDTSEFAFPLNSKLIGFPSTYNTSFNETAKTVISAFELGMDPDSSGPLPTIDSVRVNLIRTSKSVIDAWGTVQTPFGNFACIRQTLLDISSQSYEMKTSGFWLSIPESILNDLGMPIPPPDSNYTVNFWTNDPKASFPVVSYQYGPGDDSTTEVNWLSAAPASSSLPKISKPLAEIYPNPCKDVLNIVSDVELANVEILNAEGKLILSKNMDRTSILDLADLAPGIYVVNISDTRSGSQIESVRLLKQ